ncbi:MAG TPA: hypothetical protein VM925_29855, partial [Labilithrix sp.]|nr:hypothetical protein [Labilithrix sp.]
MRTQGLVFLSALAAMATLGIVACSDDGTLGSPGNSSSGTSGNNGTSSGDNGTSGGNGTSSGDNGRPQETIEGDITASRTLTADKNWLLKGLVGVKAGATLTIEKGTV